MPSRSLISSAVSVSILSSLRSPLVHPRPDLSDPRVDFFERIAQRGQRFEQIVPMKAPEVGGAGVPAVFEESKPGPHPGGPLRPAGSIGFRGLNIPDMPGKDMEPSIQIPFRACGESALLRVVRASVDPAVDLLDLPAKLAKITAETIKIRQEGERKAWGIVDKAALDHTSSDGSLSQRPVDLSHLSPDELLRLTKEAFKTPDHE